MKLTSDQQKLFEEWLRTKIEHAQCTLCQSNHWKIGSIVGTHIVDSLDTQPGDEAAMLQLICKNCGHVLLFDTRYIANWHANQDLSKSGLIM